MTKIMVVEDEQDLAQLLEDYLRHNQFETCQIGDGAEVLDAVAQFKPDLILLDLMLPNVDGLEICKTLRKDSQIPIIITTAKVEEIDRLLGLELGADDYICKPYSPREVVARIKTVLRRCQTSPQQTFSSSYLQLDENRLCVKVNDTELPLTLVEFRLLQALSSSPGRIFNRDQLMTQIYQDQRVVNDRTIDSHITKLRKKLSSTGHDLIHSVYGAGYKFEDNNFEDNKLRTIT